jgi:hypothetical protein
MHDETRELKPWWITRRADLLGRTSGFCVLCEYQAHVKRSLDSEPQSSFSIGKLTSDIRKVAKHFVRGRQEAGPGHSFPHCLLIVYQCARTHPRCLLIARRCTGHRCKLGELPLALPLVPRLFAHSERVGRPCREDSHEYIHSLLDGMHVQGLKEVGGEQAGASTRPLPSST